MTPIRISSAIAVALLLVLAAPARAQIARVAGTVTDEEGRPIKGATVTAENPDHTPSTLTSSTDDKGRYSMIGFRLGVYTFTVRAQGYETASVDLRVVTVRPNPPVNARLKKSSVPPPQPASSLDAKDVQQRIDKAEALAAAGEIDGAVGAYRDLATRVPALTSVHLRIGGLLEGKGDKGAALAAYEHLLKLEPGNARARAAVDRLR
jgi:tetratricopeptide (TPR) repeat protein